MSPQHRTLVSRVFAARVLTAGVLTPRVLTARALASRVFAARVLTAGVLTAFGAAGLLLAASAADAAAPPKDTAAENKAPVYEFLSKSGFSKRAKPEAALLRGVITVNRGGRKVVTSTVRAIDGKGKDQAKWLEAIQAAILNGTLAEAREDNPKVGSVEIAYSNGKTLTVIIYKYYYEITTSAGTIRFTSPPLNKILYELLK